MIELKKRIITSLFLLILLILMYIYNYVLIIAVIIISLIVWIEFFGLIMKIFYKNNLKNKIFRLLFKGTSLIYLCLLSFLIVLIFSNENIYKFFAIYSLLVAITSDIGGMVFGKFFKGKKLTKISPKKTISGSIGAFVFSILLIFIFNKNFENHVFMKVLFFTVTVSFISQIGDLFISFLKRKANVKDTSDILPGHGGFLDRIDGIIFALPFGIFLSKLLF
ncbi:phosphatidate cytidylyltransferase [Candidatus Pelagibacter sp. Uisw_121]|uniref:phosphatidate cytidylyltransferase n=1 Tax=Candidatus Pelagibacter sp. Uisw_121 TaxID=3230987 RepID=UPI0039E8AC14